MVHMSKNKKFTLFYRVSFHFSVLLQRYSVT